MKTIIKKLLSIISSGISYIFILPSKIDCKEARMQLNNYSAKPSGHCFTNNVKNIQYDLQIIIPVYNVKKYITKCLDSIKLVLSSDKNIMIQIIDDGSTDGTDEILDSFLQSVSGNVIVMHQKNKGLSEARNAGLDIIYGKYIMFIDSDDFLPKSFNIDKSLENLNECDVLQGTWVIVDTKETKKVQRRVEKFSGYAWGKIYNHQIFSNLHFPEGYWFEDTIVKFIIRRIVNKIQNTEECVYCYRKNPNGISSSAINNHKVIDTFWITELCLEELPLFGVQYDQETFDSFLHQCIINFMRIRKHPRIIRKAMFSLTVELIEKYFTQIKSIKYKRLESAIRKKQFVKFELLAIAMYLK